MFRSQDTIENFNLNEIIKTNINFNGNLCFPIIFPIYLDHMVQLKVS